MQNVRFWAWWIRHTSRTGRASESTQAECMYVLRFLRVLSFVTVERVGEPRTAGV